MAEKDSVIKEKVKYSGYGDFKSLYSYAYDWLKQENYTIVEELYNEKVKGNAKDLELMWRASRDITDYFRVELELKWRILGMEDVEVEVEGKKKKMNKFIEVGIEIKGVLIRDYANQWNKSGTTKFFKEIYNKYVIPGRTQDMKDKIEKDVQDFKEEMKALLDLTGKK
ncbi:hypothetical protein J4416_03150 [Candidatus Pacearchaeota archaeon]|nr:hypothetical protein [Candidatus Pacearchaeota archaeon]